VDAPDIMARSMSVARPTGESQALWQYHSRSDRHSKVSCWGVLFDLIQTSSLLQSHVASGKVAFGVNHPMFNFVNNKPKALDLVVCRPGDEDESGRTRKPKKRRTFVDFAAHWEIALSPAQEERLLALPPVIETPVGAVLVALEAKACMTEHSKAGPRFYDELNSSHQTVHSSSNQALAIGLATINASDAFISSDRNKVFDPKDRVTITRHNQPKAARHSMKVVESLPRRTATSAVGYDGLGIVVIDLSNDGSPVSIVTGPPAPPRGDIFHYDSMLTRMANEYDAAFSRI
jgi:hypothetical protein